MIKISPDRWVFALRAGVYRAQGNRDAAIADLTQTIRVAPEASDCNFERGEILAQDGQLACVMSDLAEVIRIDLQLPDDEFYYDRRVRLGDAPRMDESHFARGEMLAQSGQLDRAIADFTRAIEIDEGWRVHHGNLRPILILAHQRRGEIYRMRGEQALAKRTLPRQRWRRPLASAALSDTATVPLALFTRPACGRPATAQSRYRLCVPMYFSTARGTW